MVIGKPGCSGAATSNQRHRKHPIRHLISWRTGHLPPLKVVGQISVLNHESVAVIQQAKKDVNVKAVFVNVADVNRRR
jgi:hypothetical protein